MVTAALLLAMAVTALEQTVVSTAMPSIIAQLHGLDIYPWVFSAYLLAATVSTPLYGKLADIFGRKRVLLFGLGVFAAGSILSGLARTMPELIAMRVLQGLGAGAVGPIVLTMLADLFTLQERARVQGLFSAVWGVSSLAGPTLGGELTVHLSWRWVFFVTVPFAAVAAWVLVRHVREDVRRREAVPIDWAGAGFLTVGLTALLVAVLGAAGRPGWATAAIALGSVAVLVLFVRCERAAADPVLPLDLFTRPQFAASVLGSALIGAILFGLDTYIPLYVQGVRAGSAVQAGRTIAPLFLAWAISVAVAARFVVRFGFRAAAMVGSGLIAAGLLAITLAANWPAWWWAASIAGMFTVGLGMGPTSLSYILGVQNAVPWDRRGVATGAVTFNRTIGGALGVAILGAVLGAGLSGRIAGTVAARVDVAKALQPETHHLLEPGQLAVVQSAIGTSLRDVFALMLLVSALNLACSARLARGSSRPAPAEPVDGDLAESPALALEH